MKHFTLILLVLSSMTALAQTNPYNLGLDLCELDARIDGRLSLSDANLNVYIGMIAGLNNTSGTFNVAVGRYAGAVNTSGTGNVFVGDRSGYFNTSGSTNVFVGMNSGLLNTTGYSNTFIGLSSGSSNATGYENVCLGYASGLGLANGIRNLYLGYHSGYSNQSGSRNVFLGYQSGFNELGSDKLYIENSNSTSPLIWGDFATNDIRINGDLCYTGSLGTCSDLRFKKNISPITNVMSSLLSIRGVLHEWKHEDYPDMVWNEGKEYGVIAQDVQAVFPDLVHTDDEGYLYVDYAKLTPILLEAIREQQKTIQEQGLKIESMEADIKSIKELLTKSQSSDLE